MLSFLGFHKKWCHNAHDIPPSYFSLGTQRKPVGGLQQKQENTLWNLVSGNPSGDYTNHKMAAMEDGTKWLLRHMGTTTTYWKLSWNFEIFRVQHPPVTQTAISEREFSADAKVIGTRTYISRKHGTLWHHAGDHWATTRVPWFTDTFSC